VTGCALQSLEDTAIAGNVTVAGVEYPLFTHVHHGYGLNDAFDRSVTLLTRHASGRGRGLLHEVTAAWQCRVTTLRILSQWGEIG